MAILRCRSFRNAKSEVYLLHFLPMGTFRNTFFSNLHEGWLDFTKLDFHRLHGFGKGGDSSNRSPKHSKAKGLTRRQSQRPDRSRLVLAFLFPNEGIESSIYFSTSRARAGRGSSLTFGKREDGVRPPLDS